MPSSGSCPERPSERVSSSHLDPVGVWSLVDSVEIDAETGAISRPRGLHPTGTLVYTAGGSMCAIVTAAGRKPLEQGAEKTDDFLQRSAALFDTVNSYAGTYTVAGSTITHKVEVASNPAWVGTEQVRQVECAGDLLTIDATVTLAGKAETNVRLTWQRVE